MSSNKPKPCPYIKKNESKTSNYIKKSLQSITIIQKLIKKSTDASLIFDASAIKLSTADTTIRKYRFSTKE